MNKIVVFLLVLLTFSSCDEEDEITIFGDITLKGVVVDAVTNIPLDSAIVELYEDNEGPFMGKHILKEASTDHNGHFQTSFKYKEGPYILKVRRNGYSFFRPLHSKITPDTILVDYQSVDEFKKEQHFTLDMEALQPVQVHLKNTSAADSIRVAFKHMRKGKVYITEKHRGPGELQKLVGHAAAGKTVPVTATIYRNGNSTVAQDSIFIKKGETHIYYLEY